MDVGYSLKPDVDINQTQGAFIHVECFTITQRCGITGTYKYNYQMTKIAALVTVYTHCNYNAVCRDEI